MDSSNNTDSIINTGQVFYRSDTGDMKVTLNVLGTGAWATGGNLNAGRSLLLVQERKQQTTVAGGDNPALLQVYKHLQNNIMVHLGLK